MLDTQFVGNIPGDLNELIAQSNLPVDSTLRLEISMASGGAFPVPGSALGHEETIAIDACTVWLCPLRSELSNRCSASPGSHKAIPTTQSVSLLEITDADTN
jgi:hypothetical protein